MTSYDSDRRVWSGPRIEPLFDPRRSAGDVLLELLARNPDKPVQIDGDTGRTLTRDELRLRAIRIAQHLEANCSAVKEGIVTIAALGNENLIPLVVALQCLAVPYNPLFPNYTEDEMAHMMRRTQSRLMFCDAWNYATVREAARKAVAGNVEIFIIDEDVDGVRSIKELLIETGKEHDFKPTTVEDSSKTIWTIFCSSGTTGLPKGVCLSHANRTSPFIRSPHFFNTGMTNTKILALGSIHWISVAFSYDMALFYDGVVIFSKKPFSEDLFFDLVEKYKINALNGPPIYANVLANHPRAKRADLSSVVSWTIGGYFVSDDIRDAVNAILPNGKSHTVYASTECGVIAMDVDKWKRGSIGPLSPNMQMRIVDDEGNALGVGEQGELLVKRLIPFLGYFQQPEATRAVLDSEGWFRTGDVGYFDEEGFLYLVDRKSEIIMYIDPVSPTQLEELIARIDGVKQVCIVGVPVENKSAELPTAVVVRKAGSEVAGEEIADYVARNVRDHMKLRGGVYFVDQLPLTSKGNVKRKDVKSLVLKMLNIRES